MRLALTILATATLVGCSDGSDVAPTPSVSISTFVAEESGVCIQGATVQVVAGQALGRSETQKDGTCNTWDLVGGIAFTELVPGVELTLRASAAGYLPQEKVVVPRSGFPLSLVIITLSRSQ
jgi:hypothetical protein